MKMAITCLFVASISLATDAQVKEADLSSITRKFLDIPYETLSPTQTLDIYLPDEGVGPFPVILSIHGGAWLAGDKRDGQETPMLEGLKRGYAVVSINYRLSGEAKWPAQIYDCIATAQWIRANAKEYRLDPDRIAAWGGSAGGHLSAMLGTSGGIKSPEDRTLENPHQSSCVQAVVDWFGPTDFLKMDEQLNESGVEHPMRHSVSQSPEAELLGKDLKDVPELVKEAEPESYVSSDDPPFFIQHGLEDNLVRIKAQSFLHENSENSLDIGKCFWNYSPQPAMVVMRLEREKT